MVVDIGEVKRHIKPKADSTLLNMRKADLIEYIRCLEHNYNVAVSFNENQARYIESLNVVEVVHAHWVPFYEEVPIYNGGGFTERRQTGWVCSKCGKGFTQFGHQKYCGDCGAKMDGDSHEQG